MFHLTKIFLGNLYSIFQRFLLKHVCFYVYVFRIFAGSAFDLDIPPWEVIVQTIYGEVIASAQFGLGHVLLIGDEATFYNSYMRDIGTENDIFTENIVDWVEGDFETMFCVCVCVHVCVLCVRVCVCVCVCALCV